MANMKILSDEMAKLKRQIETVLYVSGYHEYDDLSALEDYRRIRTADERQKLEEYRNLLYKVEEVQSTLAYYDRPVREVSRLHMNADSRYETDRGHYYTSGSCIEFMRVEEVCDPDTGKWEDAYIWTTSYVENRDGEYYIAGYPSVDMSGLKVRVR